MTGNFFDLDVAPAENSHKPNPYVGHRPISRERVYRQPVAERVAEKVRTSLKSLLTPPTKKTEDALDARLANLPSTSRTNVIVFASPRGGVGKSMGARAVGGILAQHVHGKVVLVDADRDYGPARDLALAKWRSDRTISDLLSDFATAPDAPRLHPYLSRLSDKLWILSAPRAREEMLALGAEQFERALGLLANVDVVLMDCAAGIGELQEHLLSRADQAVVFATPDFVAAGSVAGVLSDRAVPLPRATLVLNNPRPPGEAGRAAIEDYFAGHGLPGSIHMPYDQEMRVLLDKGLYELSSLKRRIRVPLKRLAVTVGEGLL